MTGQVVWEGVPLCAGDKRPALSESGGVFTARWRGIIPVHYVDTTIRNPLMAITASVTRRERLPTAMPSPTPNAGPNPEEPQADQPGNENVTLAKLNNADLLHGLAGEHRSSAKLTRGLTRFRSLPGSPLPRQRVTPMRPLSWTDEQIVAIGSTPTVNAINASAAPPEVSRKSYRVLLSLNSALQVRMRAIPPTKATQSLPRMLCVEISVDENVPVDFEVQHVEVQTGGKTHIRSLAPLAQEPEYPFTVVRSQTHEFIYAMPKHTSSPAVPASYMGHPEGSNGQPIAIKVTGRPYLRVDPSSVGSKFYLAPSFESRWTCILDTGDSPAMRTATMETRVRSEASKPKRSNTPSVSSFNRLSQSECEDLLCRIGRLQTE
jgi:hypothetical protein